MNLWRATGAGVVGSILVVVIVGVGGWIAGTDADLCTIAGAVILGAATDAAWIIGLIAQLVLGAIAGIVYAVVFEWVAHRGGTLVGVAVGIVHVVVAGLGIGFVPGMRLMAADVQPPGAFMEYYGIATLVAFILAHLAFGGFVGRLYGGTRHVVIVPRAVWVEERDELGDRVFAPDRP